MFLNTKEIAYSPSKIIGNIIPISGTITPVIQNLVSTKIVPQIKSVTIKNIKLKMARLWNLLVTGKW